MKTPRSSAFRRIRISLLNISTLFSKDGDEGELLQALQRMSKAFGGVGEIADRAELNAKSLYRALSAQGNPEMKTLVAILKAMGMRLSVKPIEDTRISA